jgi:ArsR family transcriptional regulator, zinc-responsive transcriptional repressor
MSKINLSREAIQEAADCLKIIAHPVRLQIIQLLAESERSVGQIAKECRVAQNVASTHLKLLERCKLLSNTRYGQTVQYRIAEKHLFDLLKCLEKRFS